MASTELGVLVVLVVAVLTAVNGDGTISFVDNNVYVDESSGVATLRVQRTGGTSGKILFSCTINNASALEDFDRKDGTNWFNDGDSARKQCDFVIKDDAIPEGNETFMVTLAKLSGDGAVGNPNIATITIRANDKAYGVIGFSKSGTVDIQEPIGSSSHKIDLLRSVGNYGDVTVDWQIVAGPSNGVNDFVKTTGSVSFTNGQDSASLDLHVKPDIIAENDEVFTLRLTTAHGGAELNSSYSDLQIRIPANDAPVRFPVQHINVPENQTTIQIQVFRGLESDGVTKVGNVQETVDINWYLIQGNAHPGKDFQNKNGTVTFSPGITKTVINVSIINDVTPELAENFTIHLKTTSKSVYIVPNGVATVTILANDDQHGVFLFGSFPGFLDEDSSSLRTGAFFVNRTAGTFGSASVSWTIVAANGGNLANVFVKTSGVLNFTSGESQKTITVTVNQDSIPEEAVEYSIQLSSPTGGSRLGNTVGARKAVFYVKDSDDAYGVVEFAELQYQDIVRDKSPRQLSLTLMRKGGALRSISVNYTVEYYLPNTNVPSNSLGFTPNGKAFFTAGQSNMTFTVVIPNDGFIKRGSVFKVVLNSCTLEGVVPKVTPVTPRLGQNTILYLNVSSTEADGEIGFEKFHQTLTVQEPSGLSPSIVRLLVVRDGTAERAAVDWSLVKSSGDFNSSDAGPSKGTIVFEKGQESVNLTININPDNIPELDEGFIVTLNVSTPNKLQTGMEKATITIAENDNPGGTFVIKNTTALVLKEGDDFTFEVIRLGSALDERKVGFTIKPSGANDFVGSTGTLIFKAGQNLKQKLIFVKSDGIPEIDEKFQLMLDVTGPVATQGTLGNATVVNITIAENEVPYGIVEFAALNLVKRIDERRDQNATVTFTINRNKGTFGSTDVSWEVLGTPRPGLDILPTQGVAKFIEGDKSKSIEVQVLDDVIPEVNETFIINIKKATGKAQLGSLLNATLIISKNDDPVYFDNSSLLVSVNEGQTVNLTIRRGGDGLSSITVTYKSHDATALASNSDYIAVDGKVSFGVGEMSKQISIRIPDDNDPEGLEYFTVQLMNSSGDTVIQNGVAKVTIYASDAGTGVFQFVESHVNKTVSETGQVSFDVLRLLAQHGKVRLFYQILRVQSDGSLAALISGVDFTPSSGSIEFNDKQYEGTINISPFNDDIAEMNETFAVRIFNATGINTGEDGRLGNITTQFFTILPNDDPYGVFRISSVDLKIPEDYLPGQVNTTEKNVTVIRNQGLWGNTQVLWEIFTAENSIKQPSQFDLLFLASFGSGVVDNASKRRKNTGTNVSCLSSNRPGSYATVFLFGGESLDELSISSWLLPDKQSLGYLLSYTVNGAVDMEIAINTTGPTSSVLVSLFDGNVTVDLGKNIADGSWHEIVLTMKLKDKQLTFYVDGNKINPTWSAFAGRSLVGGGVFTVGSSDSSKASYTGCVQDIRVYKAILLDSKVAEMHKDITDLTPINGYLSFGDKVQSQEIEVKTVDDNKPEDQTQFRIALLTAKGGARLDTSHASTTLTVLKSDNANGLFGFNSNSPLTITETTNSTITVERKKGIFGTVTVTWSVYKYGLSGLELASKDFTRSQGTIVFNAGETTQIFFINPQDDLYPELDENFVLKLVSATSNDGKTSSTPTSGASIDPNFTEINITIEKNDNPYGLLQFMDAVPPVNATILPAVESYRKEVRESAGTVELIVVRAQGAEGTIKVAWNIQPLTAKAPEDYTDTAGDLEFLPGKRSAMISIQLKDDDIPELNKTFEVVLYDPTGGAALSPLAKVAEITILPSDDAYGVMNFTQNSLQRIVNESTTTNLNIQRSGGALGPVTVYWKVTGPNVNDVTPMEGSVDLPTGQRSAQIQLNIAEDAVPELSESYIVKLVNVSKGRLAPTGTTSNITIQASDHPYGIFEFDPTVLSTNEQNKTMSLLIKRLQGSYGVVKVYYKTSNFGDSVGGFKQSAKPGEDFLATSGSLVFNESDVNATIDVQVLDDDIPEDVETVLVSLTKVEIVKHSAVVPVPINSPVLGSDHVARINIQRNDNASGIIQLTASSVSVTEPYSQAIVNATRTAGAFGKVVVIIAVIAGSATSSDYDLYNNVTFQDGQRTATVPVNIVDDSEPEKIESFTIKLLPTGIQGGALLGYPRECVVTIAENDYYYGLIGFASGSLNVITKESTQSSAKKVQLKVVRTFGSEGASTVHWMATHNGQTPTSDIRPVSGDIVFPSGTASENREKIIEIEILHDVTPETPEVIQITLTNVTSGKAVLDAPARKANLTISANDDPHGVVEFTKDSYNAIESTKATTKAYLEVKRIFGTFGDLRLYYSTKRLPGSNSTLSNQDYTSVSNGSIKIPNGQAMANITIDILNDTIPELDEMFAVVLEAVELIGESTTSPPRLGSLKEANVTILSNDDANGRFTIRAIDPDPNTDGTVKTILEGQVSSVTFEVIRNGGTIGRVNVKWTIDPSSNATADEDFKGSPAILEFGPGETIKTASIQLLEDNRPETDEALVISLTDPTNGATVATGRGSNLTIIISANDKVAGLVGFSKSSQSIVTTEGANVSLSVERSSPAAGIVRVLWAIHGINASMDFIPSSGEVTFSQGQTKANVTFQVRSDSTPEPDELFMVELLNITTYEIAASGAAEFIPGQTSATLSVQASDNPHGVIEFQSGSRDLKTDEANETITLVLSRLYGTIGSIRVNYEIKTGNITALNADERLASAKDFMSNVSSIIISNGQSFGQIPVTIIDENEPEIAEVFIVNVTSVELVSSPFNTSGVAPRLGEYRAAQVTINSNDNPRGLLGFTKTKYYVNESIGTYDVIIERTQGALGSVSVKYYIQGGTAIINKDFSVPANPGGEQTITFKDGQRSQNITIKVKDDADPEDNEMFEIKLKQTEDNTLRSGFTVAEVVITANDDARGVFSFETLEQTISEPGNGAVTSASFKVVRKVAFLGEVVVGWRVLNDSASSDLNPVSGNVTFAENDQEKTFSIKSLLDSTPEKDENFAIVLSIMSETGGRISSPSTATLTIAENDYPYGELEIVAKKTQSTSISVEENIGTLTAKVKRTKGNFGRISVSYQTIPGSALSGKGDMVHFETTQGIMTIGAKSWYDFEAYGDRYLILASNSSGDDGVYSGSSLYRWQGVFTKVQCISTDGAVNWDSTTISKVTYLAVANYGEDGRSETNSSVYRLDEEGHMTSVQNVSTTGASDVKFFQHGGQTYLVVANSKSNSLETVLKSKVYKWQSSSFVDQNADFETRAASGLAVFSINNVVMLAVSSFYNKLTTSYSTDSPVLKWDSGSFKPYKEIPTKGPIGVQYFEQGGEHFLVFGNSKGDVTVHQWKTSTDKFELVQTVATSDLKSLYTYTYDGKARLCTVDNVDDVKIYSWNNKFELQLNTTVSSVNSVYPMVIPDPVAGDVQMFAAAVTGSAVSPLMTPVKLSSDADFIPRKGQLIFQNGQTELDLDFSILPDNTPEKDESFSIMLTNATGKAVIGSKSQLSVTILSNNNAHGRIGFSSDSLKITQPEENAVVNFEVVREYGQFGRVVVLWNATGDYREGQISPVSGSLLFDNGVAKRNISITVQDDEVPDLDKVISIRLLTMNETGSSQPGRGAVINTARALATLTIPGNDDPYGVIGWLDINYLSQSSSPVNKTVTMTITRNQGLIGSVAVDYQTQALSRQLHSNEQPAVAGADYISKRGQVVMGAGVNKTQVQFEIMHGQPTSMLKLFTINITVVKLQPGSPESPLVTNSPRINTKARLLEVVIASINQSQGEINFNVTSTRIQTTEGSTVTLMMSRNGSANGRVGCRYIVQPSLSHATPASSADFTPQNGTVYFNDNETSKSIDIRVVADGIPELAEEFYVQIVSPIGGVGLGEKRRVDVEIEANDDPYGIFGFNVSPTEANHIQEGNSLLLEVVRLAGSYRQVKVTWQLDRATSQLTPYNGTLTFKEGVRSMSIALLAVDDSIPEGAQQFTCSLVNADNNAKLNQSRKSAVVMVSANDNAIGVISIDAATRRLFVGEPTTGGYDGIFTIRILRSIGQIGKATISWQITAITADASSPSTTFNASSGTVEFTDGVKSMPIALKVNQDTTPEEFASYSFKISASGAQADNSSGALEARIDVAASDSPYGLLVFDPPLVHNVSEDKGYVNLTVRRKDGNIGHLKVNLTVSGSTAVEGKDYTISSTHLDFDNKDTNKEVSIKLLEDSSPELLESVVVSIQSVELVPTRVMNYTTVNGLQPDEPPRVGSDNTVTVNIMKNDDAHGVIQFKEVSKIIHEEDKQVVLVLERNGGLLGSVEVSFTVTNGTATSGQDYNPNKGSVFFQENQKLANLTIRVVDDNVPEQQETFTVNLESVSGGAKLGGQKTANVVILISDNPSGLMGFVNATSMVLANPNVTKSLTFGIARNGGAQGQITVKWRLARIKPTSGSLSQDFFPPYNGTLTYNNGDQVAQFITIRLDAYKGPEPEELYLVELYETSGGADLDLLKSNITMTVLKHGFPNGIFKFKDTSHKTVDEPDTGKTYVLALPVERTIGQQGDVKDIPRQDGNDFILLNDTYVYWKAVGTSTQDLVQTSGEVLFGAGIILRNLEVSIKGDDVPELMENFTIMLYKVDGGGDLDTSAQNVTVTIRANDDPHGIFKLKPGAQSLKVNAALSRTLEFTVTRDMGTFGDVTVDYSVTYSSWYPGDLSGSLVVKAGSKEVTKTIPLSLSAFLALDSNFRITLTKVKYTSSGSPAVSSSPKLSTSSISEAVNVQVNAANAVLRFADDSLRLTLSEGNTATVTVLRQGFYGDVSVTWKMGYPPDSIPSGYTAGQIEPDTGSLVFNGQTNNKTFTIKAKPVTPDKKLFYAIHLSKTVTSSNVVANITSGQKRTAVVEYSGVVEIAPDSQALSVTEGQKVSCRVVRLFSVFGSVRVTYEALGTSGTFNMAEGEYIKSFDVTSPDNNKPQRDYTFNISITQVTGTGSPRIGTKTVSTVTVKDNDNANGIISFKTKTLKVAENVTSAVTHKVSLELQRTGGTLGTVSVMVRTVGGGEPWDRFASPQPLKTLLDKRNKDGSATVAQDYNQLLETVTFADGVTSKTIQLTIRDDDVPEPDETVYLYLANVTGGAVLGTNAQSLQSWSVVTIEGNDLMNGEVGYVAGSMTATVDEDGAATATLTIERTGATFGSVSILNRSLVWHAHQVTILALYKLKMEAFSQCKEKPTLLEWEKARKSSPTFFFWDLILRYEMLVLLVVRAHRQRNFDLYVEALEELVPFFFALDHINYARWTPIHIRDMKSLPDTIAKKFREEGDWVLSKSGNEFSAIPFDQAHEQENKVVKSSGGAVGLTENPTAFRRWMLSGPEMARLLHQFEDQYLTDSDNDSIYQANHETGLTFQKTFKKQVNNLVDVIRRMGNPFLDNFPELVTLDNRDCMDDSVAAAIFNLEALGKNQYLDFMKAVIQDRTTVINNPLKKNNLPLFGKSTSREKSKQTKKIATLQNNVSLFAQLYIAMQSRDANLEEFFSHEVQSYPPSLSEFGNLRLPSAKSDLLKCIQCQQPDPPSEFDCKVCDGAVIVHCLPVTGAVSTFDNYADNVFLPYIQNQSSRRIDIVWDSYVSDSLKQSTREKRGKGIRRKVSGGAKIPTKWLQFLRDSANKEELFTFLTAKAAEHPWPEAKEIYVTAGVNVIAIGTERPMTVCSHEEADTRIVVHVHHAIQAEQVKTVLIRTVDTDVVVVLVGKFYFLKESKPDLDLWVAFGMGRNFKFISINAIYSRLGEARSRSLPVFHALSGCDTTSSFFGKSKISAWKAWELYPDVTQTFQFLAENPFYHLTLSSDHFTRIERFAVILYDKLSQYGCINKVRMELFCKNNCTMDRLPPTKVVWRVREQSKRSQLLEYQGTAVFKPGVKETEFTIRLRNDNTPEFKDSFHVDLVELQNSHQARINPSASSAVITVLDSDYPYGMVGFAPTALYTAVNLQTTEVSLGVVRTYGNSTDITITYKIEMLPGKSTESGIPTYQAVVGQDYSKPTVTTLKMGKGQTSAKFTVTLTPETPSDNRYPKAFKVKIINVTNNAVINSQASSAMVIISSDEDTTRFLALRSTSRLSPLSDKEINKILADLKIYVKKPLNDDRIALTKDTITNVLNEKKNKPLLSQRRLQGISKTTLMDIVDVFLDPSRSDTKGHAELANLFEAFAFSLAYGESCPASASLGIKGKYAYATAYRKTPESLNGLELNSVTGKKHFFSYPVNMFIVGDNSQKSQCNDVHFIEYHNSHWFTGAVLNDKVLSTSLNDTSTINANRNPSTYKIYTGNKRVTPKGAKCVYWDFTKKEWSTKGCSVKSDKEDYVECQCNHMSNFASQGQSDDRVGYSTYFFAACFVCLGAFALALLSHHACSVDNLFSAKLLMHMFFSCMIAHLIYVVGAYVSSSQAVIAEDPPVRCSVLGMFIHYFFLCQFSWMFIQGWNLWRILVLNDEHTDRKYVLFFVLGWGMPVVAIVLYIIIAQAAFSWSLYDMYGDVHKNGDMCFIPNAYAALGSVLAPTLVFLMGVAVVFTQAYQVTMQWRYYDDIYRGHYNIKEVRHIIILFILVTVTWVFAGLHLAYGYIWMIILFAIFDVILGLYVFILYFILRNQVRSVFKRTYAFRGEPPPIHTHDDFFRSQLGTDSGSSKRYKRPSPEIPINISSETFGDEPVLLKNVKFSDWDDMDNTPRSNRKLMVNMDDDTGSFGQINDTFEDDIETQDFDDLIFALKTGGHFDPDEDEKPTPDRQEHFELRRISIPDTHL